MPRPALSAARGFDIIDLLAASPERSFSLSEIARLADINVASCHAVLNALVERGYLVRHRQSRTYSLGLMLLAAGHAAVGSHPLLARARIAGEGIVRELDIPVAISTVIGGHIVGVAAFADSGGKHTGIRVGQRVSLIPPIGAPFVVWAGDEAIAEWLEAAPGDDPAWREELRCGIDSIRARGFEVLLRSTETRNLASQLNAFAAGGKGADAPPSPGFFRLGPDMSLPATLDPTCAYDVTMIAAPIFDRDGACAFNLCLGPFPGMLSGAEVLDHADRLLAACVSVMQADRNKLG